MQRNVEKVEMRLCAPKSESSGRNSKVEGGVCDGLPCLQLFDMVVHTIPKEALLQMRAQLGVVNDRALTHFFFFRIPFVSRLVAQKLTKTHPAASRKTTDSKTGIVKA